MIKLILINTLILSHLLCAQGTKNENPIPAYGNSIQYVYEIEYLRNLDKSKKLLNSEFIDQTTKYDYVYHGHRDSRLSQIIDGKRVLIYQFKDSPGKSLVEVKKVDENTIYVLSISTYGYQLYWLARDNQIWERKMLAFFFNFLPSDGKGDRPADIKKVSITDSGGLFLAYNKKDRADDNYTFTFGDKKVKLNDNLLPFDGTLYWFKGGKVLHDAKSIGK